MFRNIIAFNYLTPLMRFLRKILLALGAMILLAALKALFRKFLPSSTFFHFNLLSVLQMLFFFWAIFTGVLEALFWKKLAPRTTQRRSLLTFLCLLALSEAASGWLLYHPRHIPSGLLNAFRYYYNNYDRDIPQFDPKFARYDPNLFYKLVPDNHALFDNVEFSDSIATDSLGFRTGKQALGHPQILCLGDSYTFGWGVRQEESFPSLLENMLHVPVLNTGVPSYGTAREMASIRPLDKTGVSTIIIQYCYNDADENKASIDNHFQPVISSLAAYDSACNQARCSQWWFPGKYSCTLLKLLLDDKLLQKIGPATPTPPPEAEKEAERFLDILQHSGLDFDHTRVVVFNIGDYESLSGAFISALEKKLATPEYKSIFKQQILPLHIENLLDASDYYILDEHIKASGHRKIAQCLASAITHYREQH